jgi:hypothetical protein
MMYGASKIVEVRWKYVLMFLVTTLFRNLTVVFSPMSALALAGVGASLNLTTASWESIYKKYIRMAHFWYL